MLIKSIGFKSENIDNELNFDKKKNTLANINGCLLKKVS